MIEYWKIKHMKEHLKLLKEEDPLGKGRIERNEIKDTEGRLKLMMTSWEAGYAEGFNDGFDKDKKKNKVVRS